MSQSMLRRLITQGAFVVAKCVGCGEKRSIKPGEVDHGDVPMCEKCGSPMIAERASTGAPDE